MNRNARPKRQPTGDYDVGFARTPRRTRWKKGQSGNAKGRPKGAKNIVTFVTMVLNERLQVRDGDRTIGM
jgi:hypothetical protein